MPNTGVSDTEQAEFEALNRRTAKEDGNSLDDGRQRAPATGFGRDTGRDVIVEASASGRRHRPPED